MHLSSVAPDTPLLCLLLPLASGQYTTFCLPQTFWHHLPLVPCSSFILFLFSQPRLMEIISLHHIFLFYYFNIKYLSLILRNLEFSSIGVVPFSWLRNDVMLTIKVYFMRKYLNETVLVNTEFIISHFLWSLEYIFPLFSGLCCCCCWSW